MKPVIVNGIKLYLYVNKENRVVASFVTPDGVHRTRSYPRILMENHLGRKLLPNEDVHHIDNNPLNNDISNLQIVLHGEHQSQHNIIYHDEIVECPICHKKFVFTAKQLSDYHKDLKRGKHRGKTCSRHCAYLFGKL